MSRLFLTVLNMSLSGTFVIAVIALARFPLKKAPKIITYMLWAVAGFRLIFPFPIRGLFSLLPFNSTPIPPDLADRAIPQIETGITLVDKAVSSALPAASPAVGAGPLQAWLTIGSSIWLAGVMVMLLYSILSIVRLKRQLRSAVNVGGNIYETAHLKTPFVIGLLHPQIFIPAGLDPEERRYIILHEQVHIRRHDPAMKILAYFILSLHWFNPLAWLAFLLMSTDMEMSCDERVLGELGSQIKTAYSRSLIRLAAGRPIFSGSPLAFGEGGMKERIKNVLNFKKPTRVIIIFAVILMAGLGLGLALNRDAQKPADPGEINQAIPSLTITTPHDLYSPFMSSMFGFELVVQGAPPNTTTFNYVCDKGSFCTYGNDRVKIQGDKVTTVEMIYWTGFSEVNQQFITENGNILITVTALDDGGHVLASGSALVECGNDGEWFRFLGKNPAAPSPTETPAPDGNNPDQANPPGPPLAIEHSIITGPKGIKAENNEVTSTTKPVSSEIFDKIYLGMTSKEVYKIFGEPDYQASGLMWFGYNNVGTFDPSFGFNGTISRISVGGKNWDVYKLINETIKERNSLSALAYLTESHQVMKFSADKNGFTAEVQSVLSVYGRKGDYDVELKSSTASPVRLSFIKNKNNDYKLSSYHEWTKEENWGWYGNSDIESLQNNCYTDAMYHFVGAIPSEGRYSIGVGTAALTNVAESNTISGFFTIKYFPGATLQIQKWGEEWAAYKPQTWIIEYTDRSKNITVGKDGSSVIPITDDLIGIYNVDEKEYSIKFEKY